MSKGISANVGGSYQQAKASYVNVNGTWTQFGGLQWAQVSNTPTGTYKGSDGHTYAYYLFESDGTLTVTTAGLLEVLVVGGGGGNNPDRPGGGVGGYIVTGLHSFDSGSASVVVGKAGVNSNSGCLAGRSQLGHLVSGVASWGSGGAGTQGAYTQPYTSTITGSTLQVSGNRKYADYGGGANTGTGGQPGVVIAKTRLN